MRRIAELEQATYQDILDAPEGMVAQLINGTLSLQPRPANAHARAMSELHYELKGPFDRGRGGPGGWWIVSEPEIHFSADTVLVPDLAGWRRESMPHFETGTHFKTVPDWVCEILSPSTRGLDIGPKRDAYASFGVTFLWQIDPDAQTLEVFELQAGRYLHLGTAYERNTACFKPFDVVGFDLASLWVDAAD